MLVHFKIYKLWILLLIYLISLDLVHILDQKFRIIKLYWRWSTL